MLGDLDLWHVLQSVTYSGDIRYASVSQDRTCSSTSSGSRRFTTYQVRLPDLIRRAIRGLSITDGDPKLSATHLVIGRSCAKDLARLRKMPTETGSTCTVPSDSRCSNTASKIGRSRCGPVAKYCSSDIAGAHSCVWLRRPNRRAHSGHVHPGIGPVCPSAPWCRSMLLINVLIHYGGQMAGKPKRIFDRDVEWRRLTSFASASGAGTRLGVVSGRRRQGKTFLVEALARQTGGLYFGATEATETESLRQFGQAVANYLDLPLPQRFANWDEAVTHLFSVVGAKGRPVVIDEFPYLSRVSPALPSIMQREIDRGVAQDTPGVVLLCGSAMSVMGGLLAGSAPLRGRAGLELVIRPFEYPVAARFWGITDPRLAVLHHAVVGGTPAYRRFVNQDAPSDVADFDDWVTRTVLSSASPLFREARYLLDEEADVRNTALYHSVLAAVAGGNNTRGGIAGYVGRKATDIGHHLTVLEDAGLLRRDADLFRSGRSVYRIAEPLITFYQVVMRSRWGLLESGRADMVWRDAMPRFLSQVVGPHFEQLCREFAAVAPPELFGALPGEVGAGVVPDPARRGRIEVDVAVLAPAVPGERRRVLSLGEARWGEVMGRRQVERLGRARELLAAKGFDTGETVLALYGGAGFEPGVAEDRRVLTVGLDRLYGVG